MDPPGMSFDRLSRGFDFSRGVICWLRGFAFFDYFE